MPQVYVCSRLVSFGLIADKKLNDNYTHDLMKLLGEILLVKASLQRKPMHLMVGYETFPMKFAGSRKCSQKHNTGNEHFFMKCYNTLYQLHSPYNFIYTKLSSKKFGSSSHERCIINT